MCKLNRPGATYKKIPATVQRDAMINFTIKMSRLNLIFCIYSDGVGKKFSIRRLNFRVCLNLFRYFSFSIQKSTAWLILSQSKTRLAKRRRRSGRDTDFCTISLDSQPREKEKAKGTDEVILAYAFIFNSLVPLQKLPT